MNKTVTLKLPDGTTVRKHVRAKDEKELNAKVQKIYAELTRGRPIGKVIDDWYAEHTRVISYNTQLAYVQPIKDIKEYLGDKYFNEVKASDINRFIIDLFEDRRYSRSSLCIRLAVLNDLFDYAVLRDLCEYNPCGSVKLPRAATSKKRELPTDDQIAAVKSGVKADFGLFAFFLLYTGCRKGEALAIRFEDIDRKRKTITIDKAVVYHGNDAVIDKPKTSCSIRTVPLLAPLEIALPKNKSGFVFGGDRPVGKWEFERSWNRYTKQIGVSITPHQLRHAYATILYDAGLPVKDSQLMLGHSRSQTTQDIYQHITDARRQQVFEKLQNFVND